MLFKQYYSSLLSIYRIILVKWNLETNNAKSTKGLSSVHLHFQSVKITSCVKEKCESIINDRVFEEVAGSLILKETWFRLRSCTNKQGVGEKMLMGSRITGLSCPLKVKLCSWEVYTCKSLKMPAMALIHSNEDVEEDCQCKYAPITQV